MSRHELRKLLGYEYASHKKTLLRTWILVITCDDFQITANVRLAYSITRHHTCAHFALRHFLPCVYTAINRMDTKRMCI